MLFSKQSREGYLLIDNRCSGEGLFESATITCSHCHRVVVLNPDRSRPRNYCRKCDHYICDGCAANAFLSGECKPLNKTIDILQEQAFKEISCG